MRILHLVILFVFFVMNSSYAATGLGARFDAHWGWGRTSNDTKSILEREMSTFDFSVLAGWQFWDDLLIGPYYELRIVNQLDDVKKVANQNTSGDGYMLGAAVAYKWNSITSKAHFGFIGNYVLDRVVQPGDRV